MAQSRSTQSNSARTGSDRQQARRGTAVGAGSGGRARGSATTTSAPASRPMPLAGAGGRRGRGNPLDFVRDVRSELRKVAWPSQRETINLTAVVLAFSIAVGLFLGGIDFVFQELFRWLLGLQGGGGL
ncbi:MAG: preprotein translocase subunit SecE [Chloroflexi bacterium]|nr:preprotein translocase subunit SecE [Chloroflexota bacterium]